MSRTLAPAFAAALAAGDLRPCLFFEGEFDGGPLRLWTGGGSASWDGKTWTGAGDLIGISAIEESGEIAASGVTITLSGVPAYLVSLVIVNAKQGLPGRLWLGLLTSAGAVISSPVLAFAGRLDVPQISDDGASATITVTYESRLIDLQRPRSWRYTDESQKALFPGDKGFEYVTAIQDQEITWGNP